MKNLIIVLAIALWITLIIMILVVGDLSVSDPYIEPKSTLAGISDLFMLKY